MHEWLSKQYSPLRSVIALFSAGGLFYVAQCHEKGARAYLAAGGGTMASMLAAAVARRPMPSAGSNDLGGLAISED